MADAIGTKANAVQCGWTDSEQLLTRPEQDVTKPCFAKLWKEEQDPHEGFGDMTTLENAIKRRARLVLHRLRKLFPKQTVDLYIGISSINRGTKGASGVKARWATDHRPEGRVGIIVLGEFRAGVVKGALREVGRRWLAGDIKDRLNSWMDVAIQRVCQKKRTLRVTHNRSSRTGGVAGPEGVPVVYMTWRLAAADKDDTESSQARPARVGAGAACSGAGAPAAKCPPAGPCMKRPFLVDTRVEASPFQMYKPRSEAMKDLRACTELVLTKDGAAGVMNAADVYGPFIAVSQTQALMMRHGVTRESLSSWVKSSHVLALAMSHDRGPSEIISWCLEASLLSEVLEAGVFQRKSTYKGVPLVYMPAEKAQLGWATVNGKISVANSSVKDALEEVTPSQLRFHGTTSHAAARIIDEKFMNTDKGQPATNDLGSGFYLTDLWKYACSRAQGKTKASPILKTQAAVLVYIETEDAAKEVTSICDDDYKNTMVDLLWQLCHGYGHPEDTFHKLESLKVAKAGMVRNRFDAQFNGADIVLRGQQWAVKSTSNHYRALRPAVVVVIGK